MRACTDHIQRKYGHMHGNVQLSRLYDCTILKQFVLKINTLPSTTVCTEYISIALENVGISVTIKDQKNTSGVWILVGTFIFH